MSTREANGNAFAGDGGPLNLHCIGVRFADAPRALRDALALAPNQVTEALAGISEILPSAEAVVLATCNRTELYVVEAGDPDHLGVWHRTVGGMLDPDACPAQAATRFHLTGADAAEHLLRVVSGLDSASLGDTQIAGQVRRARRLAEEAGTVGTVLHRLFDLATRTGRLVRSETAISEGGAGVGLAAATAVERHAGPRPAVAVIGAGDAADAICRELTKRTDARICVVNRTTARAAELAERYGVEAAALDQLVDVLAAADAVVTAVHAPAPVIDDDVLRAVRSRVPRWTPVLIDTCVPAMVAPVDVPTIRLDDHEERFDALVEVREAAVPAAEAIVADAVAEFAAWHRDRALSEVIAQLFREAEEVTAAAAGLLDDDHSVREIRRAVRRLVHSHITRLRSLDEPVGTAGKEGTS